MRCLHRTHALSFDGGHVALGEDAAFDLTTGLTIAAWVRPSTGSGLQATILSKGYTAYELQVQDGRLVFERGAEYAGASLLAMGEWSHLAVTFDAAATGDTTRLFVNGVLDAGFRVPAPLAVTGDPLMVGRRPPRNAGLAPGLVLGSHPLDPKLFHGLMGGLAIWSAPRSAWTIRQDLNSPLDLADPQLVAYWPMDQPTGTTLRDATGRHDGTLGGEVSWVEVDRAPTVRPRRTRLRNTSVQVLAQHLHAPPPDAGEPTASAPGPAAAPSEAAGSSEATPPAMALTETATAPVEPLPPSGRNGEARGLLDRARLVAQTRINQKRLEANARVKQAERVAAERLDAAHAEAVRAMNSARFDRLVFLSRSRLHSADSQHVVTALVVDDTPGGQPSVEQSVDAATIWQKTGVVVAEDQSLTVSYLGGRWSISPEHTDLGAGGTGRFKGSASYALPGAPGGCLVGRIGDVVFEIGQGATAPARLAGELELTCNDDVTHQVGRGFPDNTGSIRVKIARESRTVSTDAGALAVDQVPGDVFWARTVPPCSLHVAGLDGSNHRRLLEHTGAGVGTPTATGLAGSVRAGFARRSPGRRITSIALDTQGRQVYALVGGERIIAVPYDGGVSVDVLGVAGSAVPGGGRLAIDQDHERLYWTDATGIWRADLQGHDALRVVPAGEAPDPVGLAVDGKQGKLYWVDAELQMVRRAGLDGEHPEDLYPVAHPLGGLTLDEVTSDHGGLLQQEVYWSAREDRITAGTPGLVGHWKLDEGAGDALDGTVAALGPARRTPIVVEHDDLPPPLCDGGQALRFDDPTDFLRLPQHWADHLHAGSFTLQVWVKLPSRPEGGAGGGGVAAARRQRSADGVDPHRPAGREAPLRGRRR